MVEVRSTLVLNWLFEVKLKLWMMQSIFLNIDRRRMRGCKISFCKAEQQGNEMALALVMARVKCPEIFKAWW